MKKLCLLLLVLAAAGVLAASSIGGQPPAPLVNFGITRASAVVGHTFTGLVVTPATYPIDRVICDATIDGATVRARAQRFYAYRVHGPAAIACAVNIPATARGVLKVHATAYLQTGSAEANAAHSWRIIRP